MITLLAFWCQGKKCNTTTPQPSITLSYVRLSVLLPLGGNRFTPVVLCFSNFSCFLFFSLLVPLSNKTSHVTNQKEQKKNKQKNPTSSFLKHVLHCITALRTGNTLLKLIIPCSTICALNSFTLLHYMRTCTLKPDKTLNRATILIISVAFESEEWRGDVHLIKRYEGYTLYPKEEGLLGFFLGGSHVSDRTVTFKKYNSVTGAAHHS